MSNILPKQKLVYNPDQNEALPVSHQFHFPQDELGNKVYLCGHSLGLASKNVESYLLQQLSNWQELAVDGHFKGDTPWIEYLDDLEVHLARIVGAQRDEVCIMNALTVNIHHLFSGFYRPRSGKYKVIMEANAFSSDQYAVVSHLQVRGIDPEDGIIYWHPNPDTGFFEMADLSNLLAQHHTEVALIFVGGVNYLTGQVLDIKSITRLAHEYDLLSGFDLAHAAGNVLLKLHDWKVDFACWCTYKYLNGGPGSLGGIFVHANHHEWHHHFQGWWGNSISNRFEMQQKFEPAPGTAGWQLGNPPVLALPPLKASLEIFDQYGMQQIREKSVKLTGYLADTLQDRAYQNVKINTPDNPEQRGAMLCLKLRYESADIFQKVTDQRVVIDFRRPDTIRVAPHPLYNSFEDCNKFVVALDKAVE